MRVHHVFPLDWRPQLGGKNDFQHTRKESSYSKWIAEIGFLLHNEERETQPKRVFSTQRTNTQTEK